MAMMMIFMDFMLPTVQAQEPPQPQQIDNSLILIRSNNKNNKNNEDDEWDNMAVTIEQAQILSNNIAIRKSALALFGKTWAERIVFVAGALLGCALVKLILWLEDMIKSFILNKK